MRRLHRLARATVQGMIKHELTYAWNDSLLLLSYCRLSDHSKVRTVLREVAALLKKIETIGPHYAITVKGLAFPEISEDGTNNSRFVVLKTASYAMANCFEIEHAASKLPEPKPTWYIDSRLGTALGAKEAPRLPVTMLPEGKPRDVLLLNRHLVEALVAN